MEERKPDGNETVKKTSRFVTHEVFNVYSMDWAEDSTGAAEPDLFSILYMSRISRAHVCDINLYDGDFELKAPAKKKAIFIMISANVTDD